jgi:hypothetical protein
MRTVLISVSKGDKKYKVSVNGIQNGSEYTTPSTANTQAKVLRDTQYPDARMSLMQTAV